ncbi:MFS transporter [Vallitalea pronyensis]|uniref:MFS transporter n=1 Tax=Vallitalea pronyensis TaxID=1348613 RepID=A0A8J8MP25_9FIRM|nr:MFS transporter [Vallitalea pronyensis]QUI25029.1 MFS transporter [Vallitalea pronyensis]
MNKSNKNMILFLLGKLVSLLGTRIYGFAMSLYILKVTGSALNFSISILVYTVPALVFTPIGGVIADRFDRKRIVLITDFLSGVVMFGALLLSQIYGLQIWIIYLASVFLSIFNSLFATSFDAALPNLVDDDSLGKVNAYNQAINSVSLIVAPVIGGAVYALISPTLFILFNGVSFLLSTCSEAFIDFYWKVKKQGEKIVEKEMTFIEDIKEGFAYLKTKTTIMIVIQGALVLNFIFTVINVAIPHILVVQYPISDEAFGIVEATFSIGALVVSLGFAKKLGKFKANRLAFLTVGLGCLSGLFAIPLIFTELMAIPNFTAIYYGIVFFIMGCLLVIINVPFMTYIQESTENQYRGRVMSLITTIASAISPLGFLIHGLLLDFVPTSIIIIYAGMVMILMGVLFGWKFKGLAKKEPSFREEPVPVE